jgi:hypothetical protein
MVSCIDPHYPDHVLGPALGLTTTGGRQSQSNLKAMTFMSLRRASQGAPTALRTRLVDQLQPVQSNAKLTQTAEHCST